MAENLLKSSLERREFLCTAELVMGRDHAAAEAEAFVRDAAATADGVRIVSVTDLPGGNPALPPEAFTQQILALGLTPITHLTGKDGNRAFLEGRLHALARVGAPNVLALTGDAQKGGFQGLAKPVFDLDSVLLLRLIEALRSGLRYAAGSRSLETTPFDFYAGAVVNPFKVREPDLMMQLYKMELKIAAGAQFLITQVGFNVRKLFELRQYMLRENLGHIPVLANVYVPTATIARLMQSGELAGCVVSDALVSRLEKEKKPQRLERAALMVAAARDLGFAGAHIGGFGLTHKDFLTILERAAAIGGAWRGRMDELIFEYPGEFYLLPEGEEGLSDGRGEYQAGKSRPRGSFRQKFSALAHRVVIAPGSPGARFFTPRIDSPFWSTLLEASSLYRKAALGCASCGDCIQDHLNYAGCTMHWCYKELRNGACGGSRANGNCEARAELPCIWNLVYEGTLAAGIDPRRFARTLIPPRNWQLDDTNALRNRYGETDNLRNRQEIHVHHR
jgi:methylenetetrahydrofolate reductase (NADPH)